MTTGNRSTTCQRPVNIDPLRSTTQPWKIVSPFAAASAVGVDAAVAAVAAAVASAAVASAVGVGVTVPASMPFLSFLIKTPALFSISPPLSHRSDFQKQNISSPSLFKLKRCFFLPQLVPPSPKIRKNFCLKSKKKWTTFVVYLTTIFCAF